MLLKSIMFRMQRPRELAQYLHAISDTHSCSLETERLAFHSFISQNCICPIVYCEGFPPKCSSAPHDPVRTCGGGASV